MWWSPTQSLRRWVRKHTPPIEPNSARAWQLTLSCIYAALGWQVFGLVIYKLFKDHTPQNKGSVDYAKLLNIKNATVVRFSGLSKVDEFDINLSQEEVTDFYDTYVHKTKSEESKKNVNIPKEENESKSVKPVAVNS